MFVVFIVLMLTGLFAILREKIVRYVPIPITVFSFCLGLAFGGIMYASPKFRDLISITSISPTTIFEIFLPVLIFDGAQGLKLRTLTTVKWPVFWLAGPGLVLNLVLTALWMWIFVDWSWWIKLVFGSLLSATDPVAVIAVLKDLNADSWVTTLTDGEAIANDGSAIIAFKIFYFGATNRGDEFSHWYTYLLLVWLVVGAPILGSLLALILVPVLRLARDQPVLEATLLLASAYVGYIVADTYVRTSGVLTLFAMGYHLANQQGARLWKTHVSEHAWEVFVFAANSMLFTLVGCLCALEAIPAAKPFDWAILGILYIALTVIRAIVVGACWPVLGDINLRRGGLLTFGALRGGVALTLALAVSRDPEFDAEAGNQVLFLTAGFCLLTILVNGTGAKFVVAGLKLDVPPKHKQYLDDRLESFVHFTSIEALRGVQGHAKGHNSNLVNWVKVRADTIDAFKAVVGQREPVLDCEEDSKMAHEATSDGTPEDAPADAQSTHEPIADREATHPLPSATPPATLSRRRVRKLKSKATDSVSQREFILISLLSMKSKLWRLKEDNFLGTAAFQVLLELVDQHLAQATFIDPEEVELAADSKGFSINQCRFEEAARTRYEAMMTYDEMLQSVDQVLLAMLLDSPDGTQESPIRVRGQSESRPDSTGEPVNSIISPRSDTGLRGKILSLRKRVAAKVAEYEAADEELTVGIQTNRVILRTLLDSRSRLQKLHEEEGVPKPTFDKFDQQFDELINTAMFADPRSVPMATEEQLFLACPIFRQLRAEAPEMVSKMFESSQRVEYVDGEKIELKGKYFGVVMKGTVVRHEANNRLNQPGQAIGLRSLLCGKGSQIQLTARRSTVCRLVSSDTFHEALKSRPEQIEYFWRHGGRREAEIALSMYYPWCFLSREERRHIAATGVVKAYSESYKVQPGGRMVLLLHGRDITGRFDHRTTTLLPTMPHFVFAPYTVLFVIENISMPPTPLLPLRTGVPVIDGASVQYHLLLVSLAEAVKVGADVFDVTVSLMLRYCGLMGCCLYYLLPHSKNPHKVVQGVTPTKSPSGEKEYPAAATAMGSDVSVPSNRSMDGSPSQPAASPFAVAVAERFRLLASSPTCGESSTAVPITVLSQPQDAASASPPAGPSFVDPPGASDSVAEPSTADGVTSNEPIPNNESDEKEMEYISAAPRNTRCNSFSRPPGALNFRRKRFEDYNDDEEATPEAPPTFDGFLEEWSEFCRMLRVTAFDRFHERSIHISEQLSNIVWWYMRLERYLPLIKQHFADKVEQRERLLSLSDVCTAEEEGNYWTHFGFSSQFGYRVSGIGLFTQSSSTPAQTGNWSGGDREE